MIKFTEMAGNSNTRITSLDLLKGIVMVVMALDHVRDYTHYSVHFFSPTDPWHTTWPIFFTRWITHYCAPVFSFLAGTSAYLVGKRKTVKELSGFLLKRGLWLIFLELTVINFAWFFDPQFRNPSLITIWSLGASMVVLAALVYAPRKFILAFSLVLIFGHNALDGIKLPGNVLWAMLHQPAFFPLGHGYVFNAFYPLVPWIAVMSLGYCFGAFYDAGVEPAKRKKYFTGLGTGAIILFVVLRLINVYGDPRPVYVYPTQSQTMMAFLDPTKYPPSLLFLLMTLGPALIFLAFAEKMRGPVVNFFSTYGRVPFFYYILHIYLVHFIAMVLAQATGFGWRSMVNTTFVVRGPELMGYGFSLPIVYAIWVFVVLALYPLCKWFDAYKTRHKDQWWLSYL